MQARPVLQGLSLSDVSILSWSARLLPGSNPVHQVCKSQDHYEPSCEYKHPILKCWKCQQHSLLAHLM